MIYLPSVVTPPLIEALLGYRRRRLVANLSLILI